MGAGVRRAVAADLDAAAAVLADAFADYPWTRWTVDSRRHIERVEGLQRLACPPRVRTCGMVRLRGSSWRRSRSTAVGARLWRVAFVGVVVCALTGFLTVSGAATTRGSWLEALSSSE